MTMWPPTPLRMRLACASIVGRLAGVRRRVSEWAVAAGLEPESVDDMVLATHEALTNVADHAYPDGAGEASLDIECRDGDIVVLVCDQGVWRTPALDPGWRGRGMIMIRGLAERVTVRHGTTGTAVEMHWRLPG